MLSTIVSLATAAVLSASMSGDVQYGDTPHWVVPVPTAGDQPEPAGVPVCVLYSDNQIQVGPQGTEYFIAYRVRVLKPEGLSVGNIALSWDPAAGGLTVHRLNVVRDSQVVDVLKAERFRILQREGGLEQAMLDGHLTAAIQTPGLQVGDELEFAATIRRKDPTFGHASGIAQLPVVGMAGAFRVRLLWPSAWPLKWKTSSDLAGLAPHARGQQLELVAEMANPRSAVLADEAPPRFNRRRQIEFSSYNSWTELSGEAFTLYARASTLPPTSPLRQEAARIAASTSDPATRASAALRLVQEQIRYVYVGMDGGNFRPATADETWTRRFGDCKGKTTLLLSLLRELGVEAEAALVNLDDSDGLDLRLPNPDVFNHVLVRATVGQRTYWLDGTRAEFALESLPPPSFRWALPLRAPGAGLLSVPAEIPREPQLIEVVHIDARAGIRGAARVAVQRIMRGDGVVAIRTALTALQPDDAEREMRKLWRQQLPWVEPDVVSWHYDERRATLRLSMSGEGQQEWDGDDNEGWSLAIPGAGFVPPRELKRRKSRTRGRRG
jgi:hypothetical protein